MKIVLVVASGVHTGKEIAVPGTQFVIGRDEGCNLRPASPAISKRHCSIYVKDNDVYIQDLGSTNGTIVNDAAVSGEQRLVTGDRVKVGPLDFTMKITVIEKRSDGTPLPEALKSVAPPKKGSSAGTLPAPAAQAKVEFPVKPPAPKPTPAKPIPKAGSEDEQDNIAAMLLGMDEDDAGADPHVPEGSTVMEMPAALAGAKADEKKRTVPEQPDSSAIARDLLSRLTRRPR